MPPKVKITKEDIVNTAVDIVRKNGEQAMNARAIAAALSCSTQPVFSNFPTMEQLRMAMVERVDMLCQEYISKEVESGKYPEYKATGMAYIRFAKEEKELFKLLYMRNRSEETTIQGSEMTDEMTELVHTYTGLSGTDAQLFHLEMWAYVHGIATMFATGFLDLDWELVSKILTDSYQGLRKHHILE